ncbi:MAG: Dabb family protein [SAR324 cluster bacterium]|nr:Dabb family protein [SAR324 cluster bacterium]
MVKHIVMFKLKEKNSATMNQLLTALEGLDGAVETLRWLEVGTDFKGSERSYDVVLTTHFDDREGLQVYAGHPNHLPVLALVRELCSNTIVVDYEV